MKKIQLIALFLNVLCFTFAQKAPIKFGKIEISDLEMTQYDLDSTAEAVILCKYGYYDAQKHEFSQNIRIKILKKHGIKWATQHTYPTSDKGMLKGITFNLENGEIVKEKLKNKDIFIEKVNNYYYKMRPAMPNVKVGSVVDIEYTGSGYPMTWYFQELIPVKHSELIMEKSDVYKFRKTQTGSHPLHTIEEGRWVAKDVPAFKIEPHTNSYKNYITKFNIDVLDFFMSSYISVTRDWRDISKILLESRYFGLALDSDMSYTSEAKDILAKTSETDDQVKQAYNLIKKIKYNNSESISLSNTSLRAVKSTQSGNSADINLSLVSLLRKMDFQAFPVVLSTRANGLLTKPSLSQINNVIAYASKDGKNYLLDATEKYLPYDLLPVKDLNINSQVVVNYDKCIPFKIVPIKKDESYKTYQMTLDSDLNFNGSIQCQRKDYSAYYYRKEMGKYGSDEEYINKLTSSFPGLRISDFKHKNINDYDQPIKEYYQVNLKSSVNTLGNKILFNPLFMEKIEENPFKEETRLCPIDFIHPITKSVTISITLPEGYTVEELPESASFALPDKHAAFIYQVQPMGKQIQVHYEFAINKTFYGINEYENLKAFYNELVKAHAKLIVLKKQS